MRVLLVDDDPEIALVARLSLERDGRHEVEVATTAAEALERVEVGPPDVIVLDVVLPDMDGRDALDRLRARCPETPVVFLTGKDRPEHVEALKRLDVRGVLTKPFDPLALSDALDRVLA